MLVCVSKLPSLLFPSLSSFRPICLSYSFFLFFLISLFNFLHLLHPFSPSLLLSLSPFHPEFLFHPSLFPIVSEMLGLSISSSSPSYPISIKFPTLLSPRNSFIFLWFKRDAGFVYFIFLIFSSLSSFRPLFLSYSIFSFTV